MALLRAALGDDGRLVESVGDLGYRGLVYEAFGAGHVTPAVADRLESLAADLPVVLASRTGCRSVFRKTYGFPGSESDLLSRGLLWGGSLDGLKPRVLLTLALTAGWDRERIAGALATL